MPVVVPAEALRGKLMGLMLDALDEAIESTTSAVAIFARTLGEVRDVVRTEIECHVTTRRIGDEIVSNWREVFDDPAWIDLNGGLARLCCDIEDWLLDVGHLPEPAEGWLADFFVHLRSMEEPSCDA